MLVLAPAACILSGIALSEAFEVFTRSIKFQLPGTSINSQISVNMPSCFCETSIQTHLLERLRFILFSGLLGRGCQL